MRDNELIEKLIGKLPNYEMCWKPELKKEWLAMVHEIIRAVKNYPVLIEEPAP